MKKNILVVGSLNMDMSIEMERMPLVGETVLGSGLAYSPGGKGANQAYAIGRLEGRICMLGCIGRDSFGDTQQAALAAAGVDVSALKRSEREKTGLASIYLNAQGNNSIVVVPGANGECDVPYLREQDALFDWCDYLLVQMEIPPDSIAHAIARAKQGGKTVVLNPAPAPESIADALLRQVDYLTPNETELMKLSGVAGGDLESIEEGARRLVARGARNVLVTLGSKGAMLVSEDGARRFPVKKVEVVDTTAAGDCFNGAFVVGLAEGKEAGAAIEFANAASTIAVTRRGAQESLPTRAETGM